MPDGTGNASVLQFPDHIGYFLAIDEGREYLVRVPGSATSALSSADLAEVLNWVIHQFGGTSITGSFAPYTTEEVARLRQHPLNEVVQYRALLLTEIAKAHSGE